MIYKREINNLEQFRNSEFVISNNLGVYMNTAVVGRNFAPYHGLFIKQEQKNDQILLAKMCEKLDFGSNQVYEIKDYKTSENVFGGEEYLVSFDNIPCPTYVYDINSCKLEKRLKFSKHDNILCIDYVLTNSTQKMLKFSVSPYITKRKIFEIKRKSDMKFTTTSNSNNVKVNLSITEGINLYLKSSSMKFNKKPYFESGINYDLEVEPRKNKNICRRFICSR